MKLSLVKPISYFKAHAAELLDGLEESQEPIAITQNGEVKAVIQDAASFERTQETLALLRLVALGRRDIEQGRTINMREAIAARRRVSAA
jgi:prevent-host-death family protein